MPRIQITLDVLGYQIPFLVTTDGAGNLIDLYNPTDDLPPAARKLAYGEERELLWPTLDCVTFLLPVAVPLAAHNMLPYEGLASLRGSASRWPDDLGGTGERPTKAQALGYGIEIGELLKNLADRWQETAGLTETQSGITPLITPFIYAVAKYLPRGRAVAARRLCRWPSPKHEALVLAHVTERLTAGEVEEVSLLEHFHSDQALNLVRDAIRSLDADYSNPHTNTIKDLLSGAIGFSHPEVLAFARRYFAPHVPYKYFHTAAYVLFKVAPDRSVLDRELVAMLDVEGGKYESTVREVMQRVDCPLRPRTEQDLKEMVFQMNEEKGQIFPTPFQTPLFYKKVTNFTVDYLTDALNHPDTEFAQASVHHAQVLYYYNFLHYWVKDDGRVVVAPDHLKPDVPLTEALLDALHQHSIREIKTIENHWFPATMTLASMGVQKEYTDLTVDYFLDRIGNPRNELDPLVLPGQILHLLHRSTRAEEIKGAAAGAMERMPAGRGAELLLTNAARAYDDDLYYELYGIALKNGILREDYDFGQILFRRTQLREHPFRSLLKAWRRL